MASFGVGAVVLDGETFSRVTTARVGRGLFLFKYVAGPASGPAPVARVHPLAGNEPFIELISAPGTVSGFLSRPGEALVIRAERPGDLAVEVIRQSAHASFEATFRLEAVVSSEGSVASDDGHESISGFESARDPAGADPGNGLRLCAHVARRGDIEAPAAQWVAGPGAPAAIEGVEIRGALPPGVGVDVQVLVATNPPRWLDWAPAGVFAGTRGRAMPLAGLRLKLVGMAASRFTMRADALFLGAAIVSKQGREIELAGSGAADPLVGLRLDLVPAASVRLTAPARTESEARLAAAAADDVDFGRKSESRVRVFRAPSSARETAPFR
jgi:hypothetical protein